MTDAEEWWDGMSQNQKNEVWVNTSKSLAAPPCSVVPTSRSVIERKLLAALDDEDKVALLLSRKDLELVINAMGWAPIQHPQRDAANEMLGDLKQLHTEAFPPNKGDQP